MTGPARAGSLALLAFFFCALPGPARADEAVWKRIAQGGVAVMVRHAQTVPGFGDPPGFRIGDCATQRNLSEEGRAQARRLGAAFAARGIRPSRVLSSQWCRCIDTAEAAFGRHVEAPALNSFFDERKTEPAQSAAVRKLIAGVKRGEVLVLVTHQVNITALAGESVAQGEMIVLAPAGTAAKIVGRLSVP
jgi:phosphohistidine phosphatase SixA